MQTLERLEKGNDGYAKAFNEITASNEMPYFYTPRNKIIITGRYFGLDLLPGYRIPC